MIATAALLFTELGASPAAVVDKPDASADPATAVHTTSAQLNGSVDPNGAVTTYHFQYGKGSAFAHSTAVGTVQPGSGPVDVSAAVHHLKPGTTYSFRLVASNTLGTVTSAALRLTTLDPRLAGRFLMRVKVRHGGGVFHQHPGEIRGRQYRLKTSCVGARCQSLHVYRQGQRGHFGATLDRRAPGVFAGIERFRDGVCDNGLPFKSKTHIVLRVTRINEDSGRRVKGKLRPKVSGCVSGSERASFVGRHR